MTDSQTLQQWYDHQSPSSKVYYSNFTFQPTFSSGYRPPKSEPINTPPNQPLRYDREVKDDDNKKIRVRPIPESPRGDIMIFKMD